MNKNERGSALVEAVPVFAMLFAFLLGLLFAVYVIFGRAWIQYQAEQALYCMAEKNARVRCQVQLESKLERFLPWGSLQARLVSGMNFWNVRIKWKIADYEIAVAKTLNLESVAKSKASPL